MWFMLQEAENQHCFNSMTPLLYPDVIHSTAHVQSCIPLWSWWEDGDPLPLFHLLCSPAQITLKDHTTERPYQTVTTSLLDRRALQGKWSLENKSISDSDHQSQRMCRRCRWGKRRCVSTHRHVWWHTAPSVAAPGPTSRLLLASTASHSVSRIHSPPRLSLSLCSLALSPLPRLLSSPLPNNLFCLLFKFSFFFLHLFFRFSNMKPFLLLFLFVLNPNNQEAGEDHDDATPSLSVK